METTHARDLYLFDCRARRLSARTITGYAHVISRLADLSPQLPETPAPIRQLLASIPGDETAHGHYRALRAFFAFLERDEITTKNPMAKVLPPRRRRKTMRHLSPSEVYRVLTLDLSPRDSALIRLLLDTGIRAGEAASLATAAIAGQTITITGKTGQREVPISPAVRRSVLAVAGLTYAFEWHGEPIKPRRVYTIVKRTLTRAGIQGHRTGPHCLRHTFGHNWITSGGDSLSLQKVFGHSTLEMVRKYVDLATADLIAEHQQHATLARAAGQQLELTLVK